MKIPTPGLACGSHLRKIRLERKLQSSKITGIRNSGSGQLAPAAFSRHPLEARKVHRGIEKRKHRIVQGWLSRIAHPWPQRTVQVGEARKRRQSEENTPLLPAS